jgi:hypothetical protein
LAGLVSAASAAVIPASNTTLPAAFTLIANGGKTALTDGRKFLLPCTTVSINLAN